MKQKLITIALSSIIMTGYATALFAEEEKETEVTPTTTGETKVVKEVEEKNKTTSTSTEGANPASDSIKSSAPPLSTYGFKGVFSLRGENELTNAMATENKQLPADSLSIARNYFQQPPLVPHRVREYRITRKHNKCLSCHSWSTYKKARATKISQTHFEDRDGNAQSTVAARRYFCTQCHVPQVNAKPLIKNEFKPVDDLN